MKTLLITGGAGFIGSNFIKYILEKYPSYKIINVDKLTYASNLDYLVDIKNRNNYRFYQVDIANRDTVNKVFEENAMDYVINFAAETHVDRSIKDPNVFVRSNIMGTQVLLEASMKYSVEKYIQISTDEVYGTLDKEGGFKETSPLAPNNPYSASKASGDMFVRAYNKTYGLPVNITRCSNNYGPHQYPEKLIPLMIKHALEEKELPVYGDGLQVRDWIHVIDHCRAIDKVLHEGNVGEIYNIGGNNEKTNLELIKIILKTLGKSESLIKHVEDRLGHDRRYAIDNTKISTELGWYPVYTFEQGLKETIKWYAK